MKANMCMFLSRKHELEANGETSLDGIQPNPVTALKPFQFLLTPF